jgi:hypothetical protein
VSSRHHIRSGGGDKQGKSAYGTDTYERKAMLLPAPTQAPAEACVRDVLHLTPTLLPRRTASLDTPVSASGSRQGRQPAGRFSSFPLLTKRV